MKNFKTLAKTLLLLCTLTLTLIMVVSCNFFQKNENPPADPPQKCAHETTEWIIDKNATCSTEGSKHKECVSCKEKLETATIATTAHTEEIVAGKKKTAPSTRTRKGIALSPKEISNTPTKATRIPRSKPLIILKKISTII